MKISRSTMGMPAVVEVVDEHVVEQDIDDVFALFQRIDDRFSTYKPESEISQINDARIAIDDASDEMKEVLALCEQTKQESSGFFDIYHNGILDPSGLVKGWAIWRAAQQLTLKGFQNFYLDIGSDIHVAGHNAEGHPWLIGIRDPFNKEDIVKVLSLSDRGIATSGTSERGHHIYNPHATDGEIVDIVSMTVVGPNVYEADRFATPAFSMGRKGIYFIEQQPGLEGYMIDEEGIATYTTGFEQYVENH